MKSLRVIVAGVAVALLLAGCLSSDNNDAPAAVTETTTTDLINLVQQLLATDANAAPTDVNTLTIENQFYAGDLLPISAFLP